LIFIKRDLKGGKANRPANGLPTPGSAAEGARSAKHKQTEGEAENPSFSATKQHSKECSFDMCRKRERLCALFVLLRDSEPNPSEECIRRRHHRARDDQNASSEQAPAIVASAEAN